MIREYKASTNEIIFEDGTILTNVDAVIYCTGYKPSFPFWNSTANGGPIYDYRNNRLVDFYQHTFSEAFPRTLGIVGLPRVITFRSFEYQAIALARLFSGRNHLSLPSLSEMKAWEAEREVLVKRERRKFHDILWDNGETVEWLRWLYTFAGLPVLEGKGRYPPVFDDETRWAYEHVRKYPVPGDGDKSNGRDNAVEDEGWVVLYEKDSMHFV